MTSEPNTFDAWWISEHGHPPDSAQDKKAFEEARLGWGYGVGMARRMNEAKALCDGFSKSSKARFFTEFRRSIVFHLQSEKFNPEVVKEFSDIDLGASLDIDEDVFQALTEARTCGKQLAELINESKDDQKQSPHHIAGFTFGMISIMKSGSDKFSVLLSSAMTDHARRHLVGTVYGSNVTRIGNGIPISMLKDEN